MLKIASPISDFFENKEHADLIMKYSDCLECRDDSFSPTLLKQELFHCELQPIHKFTKGNFKYLEKIGSNKGDLKLVTFHIASSCDKPYIKKGIFYKGGREYSEKEALSNTIINFKKLKSIFDKRVKFAVENNNYYPTDAYKYITDASFISEVVRENGIYFLFDTAHARVTAHNKGIDYEEYRDSLPLGKTIQIHLSSFRLLRNGLAYDAHDYLKEIELTEARRLLGGRTLKYLTIEYYKDIRYLLRLLKLLRGII